MSMPSPRQEPKLRDEAPETELKVGADAGADSKKLEPTPRPNGNGDEMEKMETARDR